MTMRMGMTRTTALPPIMIIMTIDVMTMTSDNYDDERNYIAMCLRLTLTMTRNKDLVKDMPSCLVSNKGNPKTLILSKMITIVVRVVFCICCL